MTHGGTQLYGFPAEVPHDFVPGRPWIRLFGFEPNRELCRRLSDLQPVAVRVGDRRVAHTVAHGVDRVA